MLPPRKINLPVLSLKWEHTCLNREIDRWHEWWAQIYELSLPHFAETGNHIARLLDHLQSHFQHEESQSDLSLVVQLSADEVYYVAELKDEHHQLLRQLEQIIDRLQGKEPKYENWGEAKQDLEAFLERLYEHELAEEEILDELLQDEAS